MEKGVRVDSRVSRLLSKHTSMETEGTSTEALSSCTNANSVEPRQATLTDICSCNLITTLSHTLEVAVGH